MNSQSLHTGLRAALTLEPPRKLHTRAVTLENKIKSQQKTHTGETTQLLLSECIHMPTVSLWLYLEEYIRVSRVEEVGQPLLYPFDHLWPHRVHQEVITWHYVSFVTEERGKHQHIQNMLGLELSKLTG